MPRLSAEAIQRLKERVDLRELASQFTPLRGQGKEWCGPCPRCGGKDRLHVQPHAYFCRNCFPPEAGQGRHDVLDFLVWVGEARNFREAVDLLSGPLSTSLSSVRPVPSPAETGLTYTSPEWQEHAWQETVRAHQLLLAESRFGSLGQAYLQKRGLNRTTWQAALLGLSPRFDSEGRKGWTVALPWWHRGCITAVNYRFIEPRAQRYTRFGYGRYYGETILYSLSPKGGNTLVVTEGEINALSIWQATPYDSVSVGSQNMTQKTLEALRRHAAGYEQVKVWTDEENTAAVLLETLGGGERVVAKADANALLQEGRLEQVLA